MKKTIFYFFVMMSFVFISCEKDDENTPEDTAPYSADIEIEYENSTDETIRTVLVTLTVNAPREPEIIEVQMQDGTPIQMKQISERSNIYMGDYPIDIYTNPSGSGDITASVFITDEHSLWNEQNSFSSNTLELPW